MANYRKGRVDEQMTRETAAILREIKDPRIQKHLVTVTASEVTADLKYAKIYFSVVGADADPAEVKAGLESARGFIRARLARTLNLRLTPELSFHYDPSAEHGAHILHLLRETEVPSDD